MTKRFEVSAGDFLKTNSNFKFCDMQKSFGRNSFLQTYNIKRTLSYAIKTFRIKFSPKIERLANINHKQEIIIFVKITKMIFERHSNSEAHFIDTCEKLFWGLCEKLCEQQNEEAHAQFQ